MYSNTKNLSKAVLTAAFGLFLVACNSSSSGGGGTTTPTNPNTTPTNPNTTVPPDMVLDTIAPTITSITGFSSDVRLTPADTIEVTVSFSEMVRGLEVGDVTAVGLTTLTASNISPASDVLTESYTITVTPAAGLAEDATISLLVKANAVTDQVGLVNTSASSMLSTTFFTPPTIVSTRFNIRGVAADNADAGHGGMGIRIWITFSEMVTVALADDGVLPLMPWMVTNGDLASRSPTGTNASLEPSYAIDMVTSVGDVVLLMPAGSEIDADGNPAPAFTLCIAHTGTCTP